MANQSEHDAPVLENVSHVTNIGQIVEETETKMRNLLQEVYFGKTKDVIFNIRSMQSFVHERSQKELQKELAGLIRRS
jgi:capping protein (actin filament) muscle Z-line, beta